MSGRLPSPSDETVISLVSLSVQLTPLLDIPVLTTLGSKAGSLGDPAGIPLLGRGGGSSSGGTLGSNLTVFDLSFAFMRFTCLGIGAELQGGIFFGCLGGRGGEGDSSKFRGVDFGKALGGLGRFLRGGSGTM